MHFSRRIVSDKVRSFQPGPAHYKWEVFSMNRFLFCWLALLASGLASGQTDGSLDRASLAKLKQEAFENSRAAPVFEMLATSIGPRLPASPAHKRAAEFAR